MSVNDEFIYVKYIRAKMNDDDYEIINEHVQSQASNLNLNILCVNWNSQSKLFCEDKDQDVMKGRVYDSPCYQPDFINTLFYQLDACDIFVLSTQEDDSDSKLHTRMISEMEYFELSLVKQTELLGYGITSIATGRRRGLRISVYVKNDLLKNITSSSVSRTCSGTYSYLTQNKGGVGIILTISSTTFLFCNVHLPFKSKTLKRLAASGGDINIYRQRLKDIRTQTECLNDVLKEFTDGKDINNIFVMGDLNYRLNPYSYPLYDPVYERDYILELLENRQYMKVYREYDELLREILDDRILIKFNEGKDNRGINFPPTCKMYNNKKGAPYKKFPNEINSLHGRDNRCTTYFDSYCYKQGINNWRIPSFCDRILYAGTSDIKCKEYDSISSEIINTVDHNMIYGVYDVN